MVNIPQMNIPHQSSNYSQFQNFKFWLNFAKLNLQPSCSFIQIKLQSKVLIHAELYVIINIIVIVQFCLKSSYRVKCVKLNEGRNFRSFSPPKVVSRFFELANIN